MAIALADLLNTNELGKSFEDIRRGHKDANIHLEHGAEGAGALGGRGGPEPDHGATGAGTLRCQTKPANPDPERPTRRRACCNSYLVHFSHVSQQLEPEISLKLK